MTETEKEFEYRRGYFAGLNARQADDARVVGIPEDVLREALSALGKAANGLKDLRASDHAYRRLDAALAERALNVARPALPEAAKRAEAAVRARKRGEDVDDPQETIHGLRVALESQIDITNTERAAKEAAEAKLRALDSAPKRHIPSANVSTARFELAAESASALGHAPGSSAWWKQIRAELDTPPEERHRCDGCAGEGQVKVVRTEDGMIDTSWHTCGACGGSGRASNGHQQPNDRS